MYNVFVLCCTLIGCSSCRAILEALKDGTIGTQNVALSCLGEISQSCPPGDFHYYYEDTMKVLHGMMSQRAAVKSSPLPVARILETIGKVQQEIISSE